MSKLEDIVFGMIWIGMGTLIGYHSKESESMFGYVYSLVWGSGFCFGGIYLIGRKEKKENIQEQYQKINTENLLKEYFKKDKNEILQ